MSEEVFGVLRARRWVFSIPPYVHEFLLFTPDRVIVARQLTKFPYHTASAHTDVDYILKTVKVEEILKSDKHNFDIPNSVITKVELEKRLGAQDAQYSCPRGATASDTVKFRKSRKRGWIDLLYIITSAKQYRWDGISIPKKKDVEFEDYENILRPVFGEKLSVKFTMEQREQLW